MNESETDRLKDELGKAYRALGGFYNALKKGERPNSGMLAYHSPTIGAAKRFMHCGALDGSAYFIGKPLAVLHEALDAA